MSDVSKMPMSEIVKRLEKINKNTLDGVDILSLETGDLQFLIDLCMCLITGVIKK